MQPKFVKLMRIQISYLTNRQRLLSRLVKEIRETPKGVQKQLPAHHLELLASSSPHTLLPNDPAVHWISFLLRTGRAHLVTRVCAIYLHRGVEISLSAMHQLCIDASKGPKPSTASVFAEYISQMIMRSPGSTLPVLNHLILAFYNKGKYHAVVKLAAVVLAEDGPTVGTLQYRRILQSIFKVQHLSRVMRRVTFVTYTESLMGLLENWLKARKRNHNPLDQYDVSILLQGLSPLLDKRLRSETRLPPRSQAHILSLIAALLHHLSGPIAKLALAEVFLDGYDFLLKQPDKRPKPKGIVNVAFPSYQEAIAWLEKWSSLTDMSNRNMSSAKRFGQLMTQSRALKVLALDRIKEGDPIAFSYIDKIRRIQGNLRYHAHLADRRVDSQFQQCVKDTERRLIGTVVRACSTYLRTQDVKSLLIFLSFTHCIHDLVTFIRLWKRALHLSVAKGGWEGQLGLQAMLFLLRESVPRLWDHSTVGQLLFFTKTTTSSSNLLEATLLVALGETSHGTDGNHSPYSVGDRTNMIVQLILANPERYKEWEATMRPLIRSLRLPWRDALKEKDLEGANILLLKRPEGRRSARGNTR